MPLKCPCGQAFSVTHAMNCKRGGFITMRHNDIRDFEVNLLSKVCNDVESEPSLQPITNESLPYSNIKGDDARLDVRARSFWRKGQNAFFDVRVTNADAASYTSQSISSVLLKHEREKKRHYNQRAMDIEHGSFTPLIFTVHGSMGDECAQFHKWLANQIAAKSGEPYAKVMNVIRVKLSFIILRSAILCLRGSRSPKNDNLPFIGDDFSVYHDNLRINGD